jgi:Tol biopolymer transport system component
MALKPDTQLGHYVVTAPLGAGGMGEVWKARDTTLDRDVAIKVLPEAFAGDAERLERFNREAKLLASLNHPNIAAVYGLHEADPSTSSRQAVHFIAMELVPGEDLTATLARGAFATDKVLDVARQVADALEAAHDQGVVHRDLKPANIRCTPDGKVKVLDFGLAKAMEPAGVPATNDPAQSPTMTVGGTAAGVVLGTAAYMSPEQARGEVVDRRADIWAFGCLLFEMLAGRPPFAGKSITDLLAAVVRDEPAWDALPADSPPAMRRLLRRCLAKDPRRRLRHIGDAVLELHDAGEESPATGAPSAGAAQRKTGLWVLGLIAVAVLTLAIVGWQRQSRTAASRTTRVDLRLEGLQQGVNYWGVCPIALSPDGRTVAFVVEGANGAGLGVRSLDSYGTRLLPATQGATGPFFSPDGRSIGFFAGNELRTVPVSGAGTARTVHRLEDSASTLGATWTPDDTIVFAVEGRGLLEIPATGGEAVSLTTLDPERGESQHGSPFALPDGRHLLFTIAGGNREWKSVAGPALLSRDTGRSQMLVSSDAAEQPHYVKSGHLVYGEYGRVYAAPLDLAQGKVTGAPVIVADGVHVDLGSGVFYYSVASDGTLLYLPVVENKLVWVDRDGTVEPILEASGDYLHPRISPGGDRIALLSRKGADTDVWVVDVRRGSSERLTQGGDHASPLWVPQGEEVTFTEFGPGRAGPSAATVTLERIVARRADGSGEPRVLLEDDHASTPMSWTPDGSTLLYDRRTDTGELEVWSVSPGGDDPPAALIASPFNEESARISPDGRWVAYVSDKTGRAEVYVATYPALDRRRQVSSAGGSEPVWGPQSEEIFYRSGWKVFSVPLERGGSGLRTGRPVKLFDGFFNRANLGHAHFDVAPDGKRFVMVQENPAAFDRLQLVFGWDRELTALAGDSRPGR